MGAYPPTLIGAVDAICATKPTPSINGSTEKKEPPSDEPPEHVVKLLTSQTES